MAVKKKNDTRRAKLLVSIINKADEEKLTEAINRICTAVHFSGIGHGTARSNYRSYFGFNEIEKRVTYSLIPSYLENAILTEVGRSLKLYLLGRGIAFTMPLSSISNIVEDVVLSSPERDTRTKESKSTEEKEKTSMHELVIAVVNEKYTDTAIDAARSAGATGATVFHTRSVANAKAEQSMGRSISQETDTIFFLTSKEFKTSIMEAVRDAAGLKTDGGAILFSMPVDHIVGIGRFEGEIEEDE